jgi:hypothetical protein
MLGPCGICLYSFHDVADPIMVSYGERWVCHKHPPTVQPEELGFRMPVEGERAERFFWNPSIWPNVYPADGCYEFRMAPWKREKGRRYQMRRLKHAGVV